MFVRVEGDLDATVALKLLSRVGISTTLIQAMGGRSQIESRIKKYCEAAYHNPWLVLVDLDNDGCPVDLRAQWIRDAESPILFRVVVRTIEAWLLADQHGMASFLGIAVSKIPTMPEILATPKRALVTLASSSKRTVIREGIAPRVGSGRKTGPLYTPLLSQFVEDDWNVDAAMAAAPSLQRCVASIEKLSRELKGDARS